MPKSWRMRNRVRENNRQEPVAVCMYGMPQPGCSRGGMHRHHYHPCATPPIRNTVIFRTSRLHTIGCIRFVGVEYWEVPWGALVRGSKPVILHQRCCRRMAKRSLGGGAVLRNRCAAQGTLPTLEGPLASLSRRWLRGASRFRCSSFNGRRPALGQTRGARPERVSSGPESDSRPAATQNQLIGAVQTTTILGIG